MKCPDCQQKVPPIFDWRQGKHQTNQCEKCKTWLKWDIEHIDDSDATRSIRTSDPVKCECGRHQDNAQDPIFD